MYTGDYSTDGYVPSGLGIGGGDYIDFKLCLNCGQIQDTWPKQAPILEECETCHGGVFGGNVMHIDDCPEIQKEDRAI
jgi:hypothetical protein